MEEPKAKAALVEDELEKVWMKTVEAEQRTVMLEELIRAGVGTNDIEFFEKDQASKRGGEDKSKRDENLVISNMTAKLKNCKKEEVALRKRRGRLRSKLESLVGS